MRPRIHLWILGREKSCELIALRPHSGLHNLERWSIMGGDFS
jgi:hypothetical protein